MLKFIKVQNGLVVNTSLLRNAAVPYGDIDGDGRDLGTGGKLF
jgi:hypothetical protein